MITKSIDRLATCHVIDRSHELTHFLSSISGNDDDGGDKGSSGIGGAGGGHTVIAN